MNICIQPSFPSGTLFAPSSKSLTHRAIICASFAEGSSVIHHPLFCDDTNLTIQALKAIGVKFIERNHSLKVIPPKIYAIPKHFIECGNSGSTFRFLLPIFCQLFGGMNAHAEERLLTRIKETEIDNLNIQYKLSSHTISILNWTVNDIIILNDNFTSQYISGLLLATPFFKHKTTIIISNVTKEINPYILLTLHVMRDFGIEIQCIQNEQNVELTILPNQKYRKNHYYVEGDYSLASNFLVMGALGKKIICKGLKENSIQGDKAIISYLKTMNARINQGSDLIVVQNSNLVGNHFDISQTPDIGPLLIATLCVSSGDSTITGFEKLKYKESNRLDETIQILKQLGANISLGQSTIKIRGVSKLQGNTTISCPNDHRIVMMLVAISPALNHAITFNNAEAVNKSYPNFWHDLRKITSSFQEV